MFRRTLVAVSIVAGCFFLGLPRAHAQCAFDAPAKAKGFKTSMVRAYAGCPGVTFAAPNTSTMAGVPGCAPPFATSEYQFDDDAGQCSVQLTQTVESPCYDDLVPECARIRLKAQCSGVLDPDGTTPTVNADWTFNVVMRLTFDDQTRGDMTVVDFPAQFPFSQPSAGRLKLTYDSSDPCATLPCLFGPSTALPSCMELQLLSARIVDPDGNGFAVMGSSSR